jgi:hypothetical protein
MVCHLKGLKMNQTTSLKSLYTIGGISAILQLVAILSFSVVMGVLGPKPTSAEEYFAIYQNDRLQAFLRGDVLLLILIGLYLGTFPALYVALRRLSPIYTALAALFTMIAVTGTFATESTFSLFHLGGKYIAATEIQRAQLIAAGEAIMASDMWNSSVAALIAAILFRRNIGAEVSLFTGMDQFHKCSGLVQPVANQSICRSILPGSVRPGELFPGGDRVPGFGSAAVAGEQKPDDAGPRQRAGGHRR